MSGPRIKPVPLERWAVREGGERMSIVADSRTVCYIQICRNERELAALIAQTPALLALARQYASECGDCAGAGVTPDDQDCPECKFIRDTITRATTP